VAVSTVRQRWNWASNSWALRARQYEQRRATDVGGAPRLLQGVEWTVPFAAFLAYIFAITTYRLPLGTPAMLAGLVGLAIQRERLRFPRFLIPFGLLVLWCAIGYAVTAYPVPVADQLIELVKLWAIALVCANAVRTRPQLRLFIVFVLGCFALYPLRGAFFNYVFYNNTAFGRAIWVHVYSNPNDLAALTVLQLSLVSVLLVTEARGWVRRAALTGIALLSLLILMTQSRGGVIALAVFVVAVLCSQWRQLLKFVGPRRRVRVLVIGGAVLAAIVFIAPAGVWTRVSGLQNATDASHLDDVDPEGSARQRYEIWKVAAKIIREHPMMGVGVGAYNFAHETYATGEEFDPIARGRRDTHSTILNVLAETGIPGCVAFVAVVLTAVISAERARRKCKGIAPRQGMQLFLLEAGLLAFFAAAVFGSFAALSFLYIHLALLWCLGQVVRRELAVDG